MTGISQGGISVGTSSIDIIAALDYKYNLFLCAHPDNTDTVWVTLSSPDYGALPTPAVVGEGIPITKGGSFNLTRELGIIGCTVSAISQSGSQDLSRLMV